jgi:beta-mannosidase
VRWIHKGDYREGAENVMTGCWGDIHTDFRQVCGTDTPQKVEFGTTHAAPLETAKQILKPEEQWPPDWDRWYYLNYDPVWPYLKGIDVDELSGLEELVERSQTWAARQIKESIEYLRQRKWDPTASMFLYFWSDPWPCLGGSGILDYFRRKYKGYDSFVTAYTPVLASIEWVKEKHVVGDKKCYEPGETFKAKLWATNDRTEGYEKAVLTWAVRDSEGAALEEGSKVTDVPADRSQVVREVSWPIPADAGGSYRMEVELTDDEGAVLSRNWFEFQVADGA